MLGIALTPIAYAAAVAAVLGGLYFVHDWIGDVREEQVHASYRKAAQAKNHGLAANNLNEERAYALMEAALAGAVESASHVKGKCEATADEAEALTKIRRAQ